VNDEHLSDDQLQRYADGDLPSAQEATAAQHLGGCARCEEAHHRLIELHRVIGISAEYSAQGVDFDALYQRIEKGTREVREPGQIERLSVWWRELVEQRPSRLWLPAAGALCAAAAVALLVRSPTPPPREMLATQGAPAVPAPSQAAPPAPVQQAPQALASAGSEVIGVDFGSGTGSVIEIALADGTSTPVVWINDDEP
jgi:anti-sigma factor RsiW